jgi:hypothetical protein
MEGMSTLVIAWVWVRLVNALGARDDDFAKGLRAAAQYWLVTEVAKARASIAVATSEERSFMDLRPSWL